MVVRVIDDKPHKSVVKEHICQNCGATLEYTPNDVKSEVHSDYGGGSDTYKSIRCPKCNSKEFVR